MNSENLAKIQSAILADLRAGQATASALSETIKVPESSINHALDALLSHSLISEHPICNGTLTVYRLKPKH